MIEVPPLDQGICHRSFLAHHDQAIPRRAVLVSLPLALPATTALAQEGALPKDPGHWTTAAGTTHAGTSGIVGAASSDSSTSFNERRIRRVLVELIVKCLGRVSEYEAVTAQ